ncbi:MAG: Uncharacterized protein CEN90_587 [Parcubacteria group bacterium Licking1014_17]|nr:MAG: Uncharacterized protein CEN90_587 [Parcubacteria group bacterium Licking1014_17]
MTERLPKVNELLRKEVGAALKSEISTDAVVTVTRAEVSRTMEHATVWVSVFPEDKAEEVLNKIKADIYQIQQIINKRLFMRIVPKIRFEIDKSMEKVTKVEEVLEKTQK